MNKGKTGETKDEEELTSLDTGIKTLLKEHSTDTTSTGK